MTDACRVCPTRLVDEASRILGTSLGDLVPPEAQRHLLIAQRELLLALAAMIEHATAGIHRVSVRGQETFTKRTRALAATVAGRARVAGAG